VRAASNQTEKEKSVKRVISNSEVETKNQELVLITRFSSLLSDYNVSKWK
jgi:hypothetical protein